MAAKETPQCLETSGVRNGKRSRNMTTGMFALAETLAGVTPGPSAAPAQRKAPRQLGAKAGLRC